MDSEGLPAGLLPDTEQQSPPAPPDPPPTPPSDDGNLVHAAPAEAKEEKASSPTAQEAEKSGSPGAAQPTPRGSGSQPSTPTDGVWNTFSQLQLKQDVPSLVASLQLVEEALARETVR